MPVRILFSGYMATVLANNKLIMSLQIFFTAAGGRRSAYAKVTTRSADDWPALGIAVSVGIVTDGRYARIAWRRDRNGDALPGTEALLAREADSTPR